MPGENGSHQHFVVAQVGSHRRLFALPEVREVLPMLKLADPGSSTSRCRGIAQVRGQLVPVFDIVEGSDALDPSRLIVVLSRQTGDALGVAVDDVLEVLEVPAHEVLRHDDARGHSLASVSVRGEVLQVLYAEGIVGHA